jgi:hypothetical protein
MSGLRYMSEIVLTVAALGMMSLSHAATDDSILRAELQRISQHKILFGHQSVGMNLLEGIGKISERVGVPVHITEVKSVNEVTGPMIAHTFIAENEHPLKKLESFTHDLDSKKAKVDTAFMKFCFVDFTPTTDAKALFEHYHETIEKLKAQHPGTTFIHVTTPLHIVEGGPKARVKYWLGIAPLYGTLENLHRDEYNALLRKTYQGREPIFDLARIESTRPDGSLESVKWQGKTIPVLVPEYTTDGGHLNDLGKEVAARELISVLAAVPAHTSKN